MKKLFYLSLVVFACIMTACGPRNNDPDDPNKGDSIPSPQAPVYLMDSAVYYIDGVAQQKYINQYNEQNKLSVSDMFMDEGDGWEEIQRLTYEYPADQKNTTIITTSMMAETSFVPAYRSTIQTDDKGNTIMILSESFYLSKWNVQGKTTNEYNEYGDLVYTESLSNDNLSKTKYTIFYNSTTHYRDSMFVEAASNDNAYRKVETCYYQSYDAAGRNTAYMSCLVNGTIYRYVYQYDAHGNTLQSISYSKTPGKEEMLREEQESRYEYIDGTDVCTLEETTITYYRNGKPEPSETSLTRYYYHQL